LLVSQETIWLESAGIEPPTFFAPRNPPSAARAAGRSITSGLNLTAICPGKNANRLRKGA
jgi:hypothetical protein